MLRLFTLCLATWLKSRSHCLLFASCSSPVFPILETPFHCFILKDFCQATLGFLKWCSWRPWVNTFFLSLMPCQEIPWSLLFLDACLTKISTELALFFFVSSWFFVFFLITSSPYSFNLAFGFVFFWLCKWIPAMAPFLHPWLVVWFLLHSITFCPCVSPAVLPSLPWSSPVVGDLVRITSWHCLPCHLHKTRSSLWPSGATSPRPCEFVTPLLASWATLPW